MRKHHQQSARRFAVIFRDRRGEIPGAHDNCFPDYEPPRCFDGNELIDQQRVAASRALQDLAQCPAWLRFRPSRQTLSRNSTSGKCSPRTSRTFAARRRMKVAFTRLQRLHHAFNGRIKTSPPREPASHRMASVSDAQNTNRGAGPCFDWIST